MRHALSNSVRPWIALAALTSSVAAGCVDGGSHDTGAPAPPPQLTQPEGSTVVGEFIAHVQPKKRAITFRRVKPLKAGEARPRLSAQSIDEITVDEDGTEGSGAADSVELVTNSVDVNEGCPAGYQTNSFCGNVTLRSFFANRPLNNAYVQIIEITDADGNDISAGHEGINSDPTVYGLDNSLGLWKYTGQGVLASGVIGQASATGVANGYNTGVRDWVFNNPDDADTYIRLRAVASLTYTSFSRTNSSQSFIDACTQANATVNPQTTSTFSATLPFPFTFYSTTYTKVNANRNGVFTFGNVAVPGVGINNVALPNTGLSSPKPGAFPFWDKLDYNTSDTSSRVCFATTGAEPNRKFVITWKKLKLVASTTGTDNLTFSAVLSEGSDRLDFVYNTMTSTTNQSLANGGDATIGTQNSSGTVSTLSPASIGGSTVNTIAGACSSNTNCRKYSFIPSPI